MPLLAETVLVLAGASAMPWSRAMAAAVVGSLPEVTAYCVAGAAAGSVESAAIIWVSLLALVTLVWLFERLLAPEVARPQPNAAP